MSDLRASQAEKEMPQARCWSLQSLLGRCLLRQRLCLQPLHLHQLVHNQLLLLELLLLLMLFLDTKTSLDVDHLSLKLLAFLCLTPLGG